MADEITAVDLLLVGATLSQEELSNDAFSCCVLLKYEHHTDRPKICENTLPWENLNHGQKWQKVIARLSIL